MPPESPKYVNLSLAHARGSKDALELNNFAGAQVAPLSEMSSKMIRQNKKIITLKYKQMDQWVSKLTMESYLQQQQEKEGKRLSHKTEITFKQKETTSETETIKQSIDKEP